MGFFNDVATNIKSAADVIGEKAGNVYDVSRHKYTVSGIKSEIKKNLTDFGKKVYDRIKDGNFDISDVAKEIEELDALYLQLDSVNELISKAKSQRTCPNCGIAVDKDSQRCDNCGEKIK